MATAATIKKNIAKLEAALKSKATPKSLKSKLEAQLVKSKAELSGINKGTKPKTSSTKSTQTALQKLKEMVNKNKKLKTYKKSGVDLEKDADRPAKPIGKRTAKSGNTYYEYRANRIDVKQPPKRYPKLEKGGDLDNWKAPKEIYSGKDIQITIPKMGKFDEQKVVAVYDKENFIFKIYDKDKKRVLTKMGGSNFESNLMNGSYKMDGYMAKGGEAKKPYIVYDEEQMKVLKEFPSYRGANKFMYDYLDEHEGKIGSISIMQKEYYEKNKILYPTKEKGGYMAKGGKVSDLEKTIIKTEKSIEYFQKEKENGNEYADFALKSLHKYLIELKDEQANSTNKMADVEEVDYSKQTSDDFKLGEIVWDVDNERYGTIIGIYDEYASDKFEVRLDTDGMQPTENLRKVGSKGDKGTKEQLKEEIDGYARLVKSYPENNYPKQIELKMEKGGYYAKGGLTEHGLKVGDTIVDDMFWDKSVKVLNSKTGYAVVKIETGERKEMKAMGGEMHRTQE